MNEKTYKATGIFFKETQDGSNKKLQKFLCFTAIMVVMMLGVHLLIVKSTATWQVQGLIVFLLLLAPAIIFSQTRLITEIRKDGIYVSYPPFLPSSEVYKWNQVRTIYIRRYDALSEYNGWGIKNGLSGKAFTTVGDMGIQLELNDGTLVLIGTRRPEQVEKVLEYLHKTTV